MDADVDETIYCTFLQLQVKVPLDDINQHLAEPVSLLLVFKALFQLKHDLLEALDELLSTDQVLPRLHQ